MDQLPKSSNKKTLNHLYESFPKIYFSSPYDIQKLFHPVLSLILDRKSLGKWPSFTLALQTCIGRHDIDSLITVASTLNVLCAHTQSVRSKDKLRALDSVIQPIMDMCATYSFDIFGQDHQQYPLNEAAGRFIIHVLKSFLNFVKIRLPQTLRAKDSISKYYMLFLRCLHLDIPLEEAGDPTKGVYRDWWNAKGVTVAILFHLYQRYGLPDRRNSSLAEFSEMWMSTIAPDLIQTILALLNQCGQNHPTFITKAPSKVLFLPSTISELFDILRLGLLQDGTYITHIREHIPTILSDLVFPFIGLPSDDIDLFSDDPKDFLTSRSAVTTYSNTTRSGASTFLRHLIGSRRSSSILHIINFVTEKLGQSAAAVNAYITQFPEGQFPSVPDSAQHWYAFEASLFIIGQISATFDSVIHKSKGGPESQDEMQFVAKLLQEYFLPYSRPGFPLHFVVFRTVYDIVQYSRALCYIPGIVSELNQLLTNLIQLLSHPHLVVQVEAANALSLLVKNISSTSNTKPELGSLAQEIHGRIPDIFQALTQVLDRSEGSTDTIIEAISRLVSFAGVECQSSSLVIFHSLKKEIQQIVRPNEEPRELSDFQIAQMNVILNTITNLLMFAPNTVGQGSFFAEVEPTISSIVLFFTNERFDRTDLYEDLIEIFTLCTIGMMKTSGVDALPVTPSLTEAYQSIFLYLSRNPDQLEVTVSAILAFSSSCSIQILTSPAFFDPIFHAVQEVFDEVSDEEEGGPTNQTSLVPSIDTLKIIFLYAAISRFNNEDPVIREKGYPLDPGTVEKVIKLVWNMLQIVTDPNVEARLFHVFMLVFITASQISFNIIGKHTVSYSQLDEEVKKEETPQAEAIMKEVNAIPTFRTLFEDVNDGIMSYSRTDTDTQISMLFLSTILSFHPTAYPTEDNTHNLLKSFLPSFLNTLANLKITFEKQLVARQKQQAENPDQSTLFGKIVKSTTTKQNPFAIGENGEGDDDTFSFNIDENAIYDDENLVDLDQNPYDQGNPQEQSQQERLPDPDFAAGDADDDSEDGEDDDIFDQNFVFDNFYQFEDDIIQSEPIETIPIDKVCALAMNCHNRVDQGVSMSDLVEGTSLGSARSDQDDDLKPTDTIVYGNGIRIYSQSEDDYLSQLRLNISVLINDLQLDQRNNLINGLNSWLDDHSIVAEESDMPEFNNGIKERSVKFLSTGHDQEEYPGRIKDLEQEEQNGGLTVVDSTIEEFSGGINECWSQWIELQKRIDTLKKMARKINDPNNADLTTPEEREDAIDRVKTMTVSLESVLGDLKGKITEKERDRRVLQLQYEQLVNDLVSKDKDKMGFEGTSMADMMVYEKAQLDGQLKRMYERMKQKNNELKMLVTQVNEMMKDDRFSAFANEFAGDMSYNFDDDVMGEIDGFMKEMKIKDEATQTINIHVSSRHHGPMNSPQSVSGKSTPHHSMMSGRTFDTDSIASSYRSGDDSDHSISQDTVYNEEEQALIDDVLGTTKHDDADADIIEVPDTIYAKPSSKPLLLKRRYMLLMTLYEANQALEVGKVKLEMLDRNAKQAKEEAKQRKERRKKEKAEGIDRKRNKSSVGNNDLSEDELRRKGASKERTKSKGSDGTVRSRGGVEIGGDSEDEGSEAEGAAGVSRDSTKKKKGSTKGGKSRSGSGDGGGGGKGGGKGGSAGGTYSGGGNGVFGGGPGGGGGMDDDDEDESEEDGAGTQSGGKKSKKKGGKSKDPSRGGSGAGGKKNRSQSPKSFNPKRLNKAKSSKESEESEESESSPERGKKGGSKGGHTGSKKSTSKTKQKQKKDASRGGLGDISDSDSNTNVSTRSARRDNKKNSRHATRNKKEGRKATRGRDDISSDSDDLFIYDSNANPEQKKRIEQKNQRKELRNAIETKKKSGVALTEEEEKALKQADDESEEEREIRQREKAERREQEKRKREEKRQRQQLREEVENKLKSGQKLTEEEEAALKRAEADSEEEKEKKMEERKKKKEIQALKQKKKEEEILNSLPVEERERKRKELEQKREREREKEAEREKEREFQREQKKRKEEEKRIREEEERLLNELPEEEREKKRKEIEERRRKATEEDKLREDEERARKRQLHEEKKRKEILKKEAEERGFTITLEEKKKEEERILKKLEEEKERKRKEEEEDKLIAELPEEEREAKLREVRERREKEKREREEAEKRESEKRRDERIQAFLEKAKKEEEERQQKEEEEDKMIEALPEEEREVKRKEIQERREKEKEIRERKVEETLSKLRVTSAEHRAKKAKEKEEQFLKMKEEAEIERKKKEEEEDKLLETLPEEEREVKRREMEERRAKEKKEREEKEEEALQQIRAGLNVPVGKVFGRESLTADSEAYMSLTNDSSAFSDTLSSSDGSIISISSSILSDSRLEELVTKKPIEVFYVDESGQKVVLEMQEGEDDPNHPNYNPVKAEIYVKRRREIIEQLKEQERERLREQIDQERKKQRHSRHRRHSDSSSFSSSGSDLDFQGGVGSGSKKKHSRHHHHHRRKGGMKGRNDGSTDMIPGDEAFLATLSYNYGGDGGYDEEYDGVGRLRRSQNARHDPFRPDVDGLFISSQGQTLQNQEFQRVVYQQRILQRKTVLLPLMDQTVAGCTELQKGYVGMKEMIVSSLNKIGKEKKALVAKAGHLPKAVRVLRPLMEIERLLVVMLSEIQNEEQILDQHVDWLKAQMQLDTHGKPSSINPTQQNQFPAGSQAEQDHCNIVIRDVNRLMQRAKEIEEGVEGLQESLVYTLAQIDQWYSESDPSLLSSILSVRKTGTNSNSTSPQATPQRQQDPRIRQREIQRMMYSERKPAQQMSTEPLFIGKKAANPPSPQQTPKMSQKATPQSAPRFTKLPNPRESDQHVVPRGLAVYTSTPTPAASPQHTPTVVHTQNNWNEPQRLPAMGSDTKLLNIVRTQLNAQTTPSPNPTKSRGYHMPIETPPPIVSPQPPTFYSLSPSLPPDRAKMEKLAATSPRAPNVSFVLVDQNIPNDNRRLSPERGEQFMLSRTNRSPSPEKVPT
ncbi:hypothetical protein BLNAU_7569 [Blattamonas nauphoetae]|uniref:Uncharacterized protein n=1 Tax=Blattamonas nauphoetae TaxID=2049346 RepID=A0ABQ9Y132_9EUKA|nr:hypothetical protein BLNAU_7569 [Blattamonas nauphoetae]